MTTGNPWRTLGIGRTDNSADIRKAYADRLREIDPDSEVAALTALREARDQALRMAKARSSNDRVPPVEPETEVRPEEEGIPALTGGSALDCDADPIILPPETPEPGTPFWAAHRLDELLFPNGEQSDEGMTKAEADEAIRCLDELVADMTGGHVEHQAMGEIWLAERLAHAWPRSTPLLADTDQALGWSAGRGELGEHPAKAFLNDRLAGMYFEAAVHQPEHPYHSAWNELSRSGSRDFLSRFRVRKSQVNGLLALIRERYPEIETRLDYARVASWEGDGVAARPWPIVLGVVLLVQVLARVATSFAGDDERTLAGPTEREQEVAALHQSLPLDLFGDDLDWNVVVAKAPFLAREVDYAIHYNLNADGPDATINDAAKAVRKWIIVVGRDAALLDVIETKKLELDVATAVERDFGSSACVTFLKSGETPREFQPTAELRRREKTLARRLIADDYGDADARGKSEKVAVHPLVTAAVVKDLGLDEEKWNRAVEMQGSDDENCAFRRSLIRHTLEHVDEVQEDLLRII